MNTIKVQPGKPGYPYSYMAINTQLILDIHEKVITGGCRYKLGAKVVPIRTVPGFFHEVDCSGYVDYLMFHVGKPELPDGSYNQHDAIKAAGFKQSAPEACRAMDGVLRIAFLRPSQSKSGVGHVALFLNGLSIESHGKKGPNRRSVDECWGWLDHATVFVLTYPGA